MGGVSMQDGAVYENLGGRKAGDTRRNKWSLVPWNACTNVCHKLILERQDFHGGGCHGTAARAAVAGW